MLDPEILRIDQLKTAHVSYKSSTTDTDEGNWKPPQKSELSQAKGYILGVLVVKVYSVCDVINLMMNDAH